MSCVELKYRHQCTHCRGSCNTILFHWHIWSRVGQVYREADQRRYRCKKSILERNSGYPVYSKRHFRVHSNLLIYSIG